MAAALLAALPECAVECLVSTVSQSTCGLTDVNCVCSNAPLFAQISACVQATCSIRNALTTQNVTLAMCQVPVTDDRTIFPIVTIVGFAISLLVVILRIFARYSITNGKLGLDDWTIMVSMAVATAVAVLAIPLHQHGMGKDLWRLSFDNIDSILMYFYLEEVLYVITISLTKASLLFFYLRLFPGVVFRKIVWAVIWFNAVYAVVFFFVQVFTCVPVSVAWTGWDGEHPGRCSDTNSIIWSHTGINIVLDLVILFLPLPILIGLNLSLKRKLSVCLMFGVGVFITIVSILRLVSLIGFKSTNATRGFVPVGVWSIIEIDVSITCACLPGLRALLGIVFPSVFGSTQHPTGGSAMSSTARKRSQLSMPRYPAHSNSSQEQTLTNGDGFMELAEMDEKEHRPVPHRPSPMPKIRSHIEY